MERKNETSGIIKTILIIVAVVLVVFICWKAGWILNGNKNEVSEQEKQEALGYSVEYKDYPFFDAVAVILYDKKSEFSSEF